MKKLFLVVFLCTAFLFMGTTASAYNILQLDIAGGTYSGDTTYGGPSGDLYALLNPEAGAFKNGKATLSNDYYLSLAVFPTTMSNPGNPIDFGNVSTTALNLTLVDQGYHTIADDLPPHGAYPTYNWVYEFNFNDIPSNRVTPYDAQTDADPVPYLCPTCDPYLISAMFSYDVSNLLALEGIDEIHFDLWTYDDRGGVVKAPFSHDASAVPEPATLLLLGGGLVGLAGFGRKRFKK